MKIADAWAAVPAESRARAVLSTGRDGQVIADKDGAAVFRVEVRRCAAGAEILQVFSLPVPEDLLVFLKESDEWLPCR